MLGAIGPPMLVAVGREVFRRERRASCKDEPRTGFRAYLRKGEQPPLFVARPECFFRRASRVRLGTNRDDFPRGRELSSP